MNRQEELYFASLTKDREDSADTLEKPSMRGVKNSVVEKYSDQAHFIYELLQNADDARGTQARFILEKDRLIFAHNGTRHFSISDPKKEDIDTENGTLGDVNAITSIANSNKTEASIGKFGVGFKAVFQYTSTPYIYDPFFCFRIERFIVPVMLPEDFGERKANETLFVFPFDHPDRDAKEAFEDISGKLRNLSFPLLFLSNLSEIVFEIREESETIRGRYGKEIVQSVQFDSAVGEKICLRHIVGHTLVQDNLWLFTSVNDAGRKYSVGFFLDSKGQLKPVDEPAYCFFPTKEVTGLKFIIHAPFLLTDSREGIRAGVPHNDQMIRALAKLAANSMVFLKKIGETIDVRLIDDNIVEIIPTDPELFSDPDNKRKVSFLPFYHSIKTMFRNAALLPSTQGYALADHAYWGEFPQLPQLFSNEQLGEIVQNKNAKWIFPTLSRYDANRYRKPLCSYIESLSRAVINEDAIISGRKRDYTFVRGERQSLGNIQGITSSFIEKQSFSWLHSFYEWLYDTKHRTEISKDKPFFLDQNGKAAAAYDKRKELILFLPVEGMDLTGYTIVNPELLKNKNTLDFIKDIGVKQPSLKDQIYNILLPQYRRGDDIDADAHFRLLFKYYCKCSHEEVRSFIRLIKDYEILSYYDDNKEMKLGKPDTMYLSTPILRAFLVAKEGVRFLAYSHYQELVGIENDDQLRQFLTDLGVKTDIEFIDVEFDYNESDRKDLPRVYSTRSKTYIETRIDGCRELINNIVVYKDKEYSIILWLCLLWLIEKKLPNYKSLSDMLRGRCFYFYRTHRTEPFISSDAIALRECAWICNNDGEFVRPDAIARSEWPSFYPCDSKYTSDLFDFLGVKDFVDDVEQDDDSNLTDAQREKIALADILRKNGISDVSDLEELLELKRQRDYQKQEEENRFNPGTDDSNGYNNADPKTAPEDDIFDEFEEDSSNENIDNPEDSSEPEDLGSGQPGNAKEKKKNTIDKTTKNIVKDILRRSKDNSESTASSDILHNTETELDEDDVDQDELIPQSVDYNKKIERAKEKSAAELDRIVHFQNLQDRVMNAKKYSFGWFNALLEMESLNSGENNTNSREVSISFSVVEREAGKDRTLVLKYPNRYIPQFMEDLADIPLVLHMENQKKTIPIEVASIKSYTLRVKVKKGEDINGIDLRSVKAATIDAKNPVFLLEALRKEFANLGYKEDFDMQENLPANIEFIFGPPGTGKTTYLAKKVLMPLMQQNADCRVLVLTPTNKASDVLVRRIMELSGRDKSYEKWLVRFGATGEEDIEQSPVFRDKTFDIRKLRRNVTITTIARFPYDFFMPTGSRIFINGIHWDYIVFDEASMIPIANIVYPLYKKTPKKFVVAGDPFQIEPITSVDLWKNENIYTMVELNSFVAPKTRPHAYKIELLTTQYRSVPDIGDVFSHFAYGGVLKHNRTIADQRPLHVDDDLGIKTLNIIKYPVSKYESIYRPKRLQHSSSYQIYSALFTFEYVCYLAKQIANNNPGDLFKIGIIAPYRAQADIINKLMASERLPKEVDVEIGTIHGFQGDECDIIFAVFNTPPTISSSKEMFLNKKNIINVSISRARDYLFIVMPDDNTENIANLKLVKRVENLIRSTVSWEGFLSPDLEQLMFNDSNYLENNTFSTSHQSVNVYGLPENCYEIRTEDTAVDVQIHKAVKSSASEYDNKDSNHDSQDLDDDYVDSYDLDETLIPEELRKGAIDLPVSGAFRGWFYLVPYDGKLINHTTKHTEPMFIPLMRNGQEKMVSVSVVEEDRIIYIFEDMFILYEEGLSDPDGIELRRNFFS